MTEIFSTHDTKNQAEIDRRNATMNKRIAQKDYRTIFMAGGCCIFALVLHENLHWPLFYSCPEDLNEVRHAFVMNENRCLDFEGWKPVNVIAQQFAHWPDVPPRSLSVK